MTTDYKRYFDPKAYFECYFDDPTKLDMFFLTKQHHFWSEIVKGEVVSLLEYGAGPTISRFISPSHYAQNIVAAEYLEANRKALQDWIAQEPQAFNWRPSFEYVVQTLEEKSSEEVDKRESEVREKIKAIVPCDVKSPNRLEIPTDASKQYGPPFDVVSTCLTLEVAVESEDEYKDAVSFLGSLVRPGGYLVLIGKLEGSYYTVGGKKFYSFPLTKEMVLGSLRNAGIKDVVYDSTGEESYCDFESEARRLDLYQRKEFFFVYGRA